MDRVVPQTKKGIGLACDRSILAQTDPLTIHWFYKQIQKWNKAYQTLFWDIIILIVSPSAVF